MMTCTMLSGARSRLGRDINTVVGSASRRAADRDPFS
jgi:hypothetical protein